MKMCHSILRRNSIIIAKYLHEVMNKPNTMVLSSFPHFPVEIVHF